MKPPQQGKYSAQGLRHLYLSNKVSDLLESRTDCNFNQPWRSCVLERDGRDTSLFQFKDYYVPFCFPSKKKNLKNISRKEKIQEKQCFENLVKKKKITIEDHDKNLAEENLLHSSTAAEDRKTGLDNHQELSS